MNRNLKNINLVIPDGNPRSIKIADIEGTLIKALFIPRSKLKDVSDIEVANNVGIYFLFGEPEEVVKPSVYIGKAGKCYERIRIQDRNKI